MMAGTQAFEAVVAAIRQDLATATEALMSASEAGLYDVERARAGDGEALARLEDAFVKVLQACAVEDMVVQRLTQLDALWIGHLPTGEGLENGPAQPGRGLDQAEIDAWLDGSG